ncbi:MAG: alpha-L-fucosidase, partial [Longimicrobiales bacterium]|nr:alpha-L-fucosidase [Longimicrobiales bacterium]
MRGLRTLIVIAVFAAGFPTTLHGQADEHGYVPETDPLVLEKLEAWQDLKLGLLMHWGPYSQWGIVESWSLC